MYARISILTRLPGPAVDWQAPGPGANTVDGLNSDLILHPLLQVLDSELPLQPVHDDMGENSPFRPGFGVLHPVANEIWIPIILPLWKRLRGFFWLFLFPQFKPDQYKWHHNWVHNEAISHERQYFTVILQQLRAVLRNDEKRYERRG